MQRFFSLLGMILVFWIPVGVGLLMIAASFALKSFHLAIVGFITIVIASLFRLINKAVEKNQQARQP
ncbi:MAG TPA: hypothetical protein VGN04_14820 [Herbaspirillum sp.]|jgi:hypothetical protein